MARSLALRLSAAFVLWIASVPPWEPQVTLAEPQQTRLRRPVAIQLSTAERYLYTANRESGSVSVVDLATAAVVGEFDVGRRLSDLRLAAEGRLLLATDEDAHELLLIDGSLSP